jgi:hypothetical protein
MLGLLRKTGMIIHDTARSTELQFADFQRPRDLFCLHQVAVVTMEQDSRIEIAEIIKIGA